MNNFYREYFETPVDRRGSCCEKWDNTAEYFGRPVDLPLWVADMDFRTVPAVAEAIARRAAHAIYGYTENAKNEKLAECGWLKRRYGLNVDPAWILYSPGVVDSIFFCVRALTAPEDAILIQPPVYGPFYTAIERFGRRLVKSPLIHDENGWRMDFDSLENAFRGGVKMMILCSPHNPVGRVWTREELERLVELCDRYDVILVSDEIHADFNFGVVPHTRILAVEGAKKCVMLTSATKSFNLAGLRQSSAVVADDELREKLAFEIVSAHASTPNIFGGIAQMTAYMEGDAWMDAVVEYIRENRDFACDYLSKNVPEIAFDRPDGTYLMWLDCRNVGAEHEAFKEMLIDAGVGLCDGTDYGAEGRGFFRLNLATTRGNIEEGLKRIEKIVRGMRK